MGMITVYLIVKHKNMDNLKTYLVFYLVVIMCVSTWSVFVDIDWAYLSWFLRVFLLSLIHI